MTQIIPKNLNKTLTKDNNTTFVFKKGNYVNTYVIAEMNGLPDNQTLYLGYLDENDNFIQLYTPFDIDGNYIRTKCCCDSNNIQAIPLPAKYNSDYSYWEDYPVGTYNWILHLPDSESYFAADYPFDVDIVDFETFDIINPVIYPNEDIKVNLRTYANNIPESTNLITANSVYDSSTGVITYPNKDIIDLSIGSHTQVINNLQVLNYEVVCPIEFACTGTPLEYDSQVNNGRGYGYGCRGIIGSATVDSVKYNSKNSDQLIAYLDEDKSLIPVLLPPGTYNWEVIGTSSVNSQSYTVYGTTEITTNNCTLNLNPVYDETKNEKDNQVSKDTSVILQVTYKHKDTPIPNAKIQIINLTNNSIITEETTDTNGSITTEVSTSGEYQAAAININNEQILLSNSHKVNNEYIYDNDEYYLNVNSVSNNIGRKNFNHLLECSGDFDVSLDVKVISNDLWSVTGLTLGTETPTSNNTTTNKTIGGSSTRLVGFYSRDVYNKDSGIKTYMYNQSDSVNLSFNQYYTLRAKYIAGILDISITNTDTGEVIKSATLNATLDGYKWIALYTFEGMTFYYKNLKYILY